MSRGLSAAAKAELYSSNTDEIWSTLLTISHSDFATTLRFVDDYANITSNGQTFTALAFGARWPADRDSPVSATIVLDNVDQATIASVRAITGPATVQIDVIRQSDPDTLLASWPYLRAVFGRITTTTVELSLSGDVTLDESYPGLEFVPLLFPAGFDR